MTVKMGETKYIKVSKDPDTDAEYGEKTYEETYRESPTSSRSRQSYAVVGVIVYALVVSLLLLSSYSNNVEPQPQAAELKPPVVSKNIYWDNSEFDAAQRYAKLGQQGVTLWMTGYSGSGKSTIGKAFEADLLEQGVHIYRLDGDNVRYGLNRDLDFSTEGRRENVRRVSEVAALFTDSGVITVVSLISPLRADRDRVRELFKDAHLNFLEVFVDVPLEVAESRDPKGLYKRARSGEISNFTGITAPYEPPLHPDIRLESDKYTVEELVEQLKEELRKRDILVRATEAPQRGGDASQATGDAKAGDKGGSNAPHAGLLAPDGLSAELDLHLDAEEDLIPRLDANGYLSGFGAEGTHSEAELAAMPQVLLRDEDVQWVQVLVEGWAAPFAGFMREGPLLQTLHFNSLLVDPRNATGHGDVNVCPTDFQANYGSFARGGQRVSSPVPIVLPITDMTRQAVGGAAEVALVAPSGQTVAVLSQPEVFDHRKEERVARTFGAVDPGHSYIQSIMRSGDFLLGGEVQAVRRIRFEDGLDEYRLTPFELRRKFAQMGADAVVAFQTRNPTHAGHVHLMQSARAELLSRGYQNPVLWLSPLGGWTKEDDVPLDVRVKQHVSALEEGMLDPNTTVLSIWPSPMVYAGPTEVQWHAKSRRSAGASFFIVGRDPAGIKRSKEVGGGDLYDGDHGRFVLQMSPGMGESEMQILSFPSVYYDKQDGTMKPKDKAREDDFLSISGTRMRAMAAKGAHFCGAGGIPRDWAESLSCVPDGFMGEKSWAIVSDYYQHKDDPAVEYIQYSRLTGQPLLSTEGVQAEGTFGTAQFQVSFVNATGSDFRSPWHDIPLRAASDRGDGETKPETFNFVVEIPRGRMEKMEVNKEAAFNPIKQDMKDGKPRYYSYAVPFFNYGMFPQTWEDPEHKNKDGIGGDNDPLDVIEVSNRTFSMGAVIPVRVLGSLELIDEGEVDHKILVLNEEDAKTLDIESVEDLAVIHPGMEERVAKWLKEYKTTDGKALNTLGSESALGKEAALAIIEETHQYWAELVEDASRRNGTGFWFGDS